MRFLFIFSRVATFIDEDTFVLLSDLRLGMPPVSNPPSEERGARAVCGYLFVDFGRRVVPSVNIVSAVEVLGSMSRDQVFGRIELLSVVGVLECTLPTEA